MVDCANPAGSVHRRSNVVSSIGVTWFVGHGERDNPGFNDRLGTRLGELAGGDTSGQATQQLDIHALTLAAPLAPGGPLCRASSPNPDLDGMQIVLKGGQVGGEQFFEQVRVGRA